MDQASEVAQNSWASVRAGASSATEAVTGIVGSFGSEPFDRTAYPNRALTGEEKRVVEAVRKEHPGDPRVGAIDKPFGELDDLTDREAELIIVEWPIIQANAGAEAGGGSGDFSNWVSGAATQSLFATIGKCVFSAGWAC